MSACKKELDSLAGRPHSPAPGGDRCAWITEGLSAFFEEFNKVDCPPAAESDGGSGACSAPTSSCGCDLSKILALLQQTLAQQQGQGQGGDPCGQGLLAAIQEQCRQGGSGETPGKNYFKALFVILHCTILTDLKVTPRPLGLKAEGKVARKLGLVGVDLSLSSLRVGRGKVLECLAVVAVSLFDPNEGTLLSKKKILYSTSEVPRMFF